MPIKKKVVIQEEQLDKDEEGLEYEHEEYL